MKKIIVLFCFLGICLVTTSNDRSKLYPLEIKIGINQAVNPDDADPKIGAGLDVY